MEKKRLLLIVNPVSGTTDKVLLVPKLVTRLEEKDFAVEILNTRAKGDATIFALNAVAQGLDAVIACGGDGTVNETACALCGTGVPLGIIPSGSGNGLARHIGLWADELAAVDIIDWNNIKDCDYGLIGDKKFFCTFGIGFDAAVAKKFSEEDRRGLTTYVKNAFVEFAKYQPQEYSITIDRNTTFDTKAYLVAVCNASQYGNNAYIAPEASITDGVFDVIIMKDASHIQTLLAGLDMMTGMLPHNRQIQIIRAKHVVVEPLNPGPAHIDGEPFDVLSKYEVSIVPHQLKLFTNPEKKKFTPFITPIDSFAKDMSSAIGKLFE